MIDKTTIRQVLDRAEITDVVSDYVKLTRKGANYMGCCPFHGERRPSFVVSPGRNTCHCFSCKEHADPVGFIMKIEGKTFPEAIEQLADKLGIRVMHDGREPSDKEREEAKKKEAMRVILQHVQQFFTAAIAADTKEAKDARKYIQKRWGREYSEEAGIGLAPHSWSDFLDYCRSKALDTDTLKELGLIKTSEKTGRLYPFFRQRITIPIRDKYGRVIGFTARYIGDDPDQPKYINSTDSLIFKKSDNVFGYKIAARHAQRTKRFVLVEGAPDVLHLQSDAVGLYETVASLGTAWSRQQFDLLKRVTSNICIIPDADPPKGNTFGAGTLAVMKSGAAATAAGFKVTVREIPLGEATDDKGNTIQVKNDPDSYIRTIEDFNNLPEENFPVWYGLKLLKAAGSDPEKVDAMKKIADEVLRHITDDAFLTLCLTPLAREFGRMKIWRDAITEAKGIARRAAEQREMKTMSPELSALREAGITIDSNEYFAHDNGDKIRISNFTLHPLYHIIDKDNAIRIFRLRNSRGNTALMEFRQDELINITTFKRKVESQGFFHFKGTAAHLDDIREVLSSITDSAEYVQKLGWDPINHFYAFGDGIVSDNILYNIDDAGIVSIGDRKYYLPAFSKMHVAERDSYQYERSFSSRRHADITLHDFVDKFTTVFFQDHGGMIAFPFIVATIFHDVVRETTGRKFPIFNVFGNKGSGKSDIGRMMMAFFLDPGSGDPPSIANTSLAAINDLLSRAENNLVHLDEYKNAISFPKIEILKQIWNGSGQTKKDMDGDKKAKQSFVRSGVILTGQDMPNRDDALLSRVLLLNFSKDKFSKEEDDRFNELDAIVSKGLSHLTIQILKLRAIFESDFTAHWEVCKKEFKEALKGEQIESRTLLNWLVILATFHTIQTSLDLPYSYTDLFKVCVDAIIKQNKTLSKNSDVAEFWKTLDAAHMMSRIIEKAHYTIKSHDRFKTLSGQLIDFGRQKSILYLNYQNVLATLGQRINGTNMIGKLDAISMEAYLRNHPAFLGTKQCRFRVMLPNGQPDYIYEGTGPTTFRKIREVRPMAFCFDYELLKQQYEINLDTTERPDSPNFDDLDD